jgi:predicted nucleic acid-binding protein
VATLVDSNVILDVVTEDEQWFEWSATMLAQAAEKGTLVINPLVYAEVSLAFDRIEELDDAVPEDYYTRESLPWEAGFLAARAFLRYRRRGGARLHPLPDFYIGAHAAVAGHALLTRDPRQYRSYFPKLTLLAP